MIRLARDKYKADWVINIDADEFWFSEELDLKKSILSNQGCNLQRCQIRNCIPNEGDLFDNVFFFARRLYPFEESFYGLKNNSIYVTRSKVIVKSSDYVKIALGNHNCEMTDKRLANVSNILIFHYPIRNYSQFEKKVIKGWNAVKEHPDKKRSVHWKSWYENFYLKGKLKNLYNHFFLSKNVEKLKDIGIIVNDSRMKNFMKSLSFKILKSKVEKGERKFQYQLGLAYMRGTGVKKNPIEAVKLFLPLAEQGNQHAQYWIGEAYRKGSGLSIDAVKAVQWFRKSAEQGNRFSQYRLGEAYQKGIGVPVDEVESVFWFKKSAEQGHSVSQLMLGNAYHTGCGIEKNSIEAIKWWKKSAAQGNLIAQKNMKENS